MQLTTWLLVFAGAWNGSRDFGPANATNLPEKDRIGLEAGPATPLHPGGSTRSGRLAGAPRRPTTK
jgi:hypothetical protein